MAELKQYLVSTNPIITNYIKTHPKTVFNESDLAFNTTRIWLSFDIEDDKAPKDERANLYAWLNTLGAESWGNSMATFTVPGSTQNLSDVGKWLVNELQKNNVLDKTNWQKTTGISLYVQYVSCTGTFSYSFDYFVLIQNKDIPNPNGF